MAYFKRSPAWAQLLMFLGMSFGSFILMGMVGLIVLAKVTGFSFQYIQDAANWDYNNPQTLVLVRGMVLIQFIAFYILPVFLFARLCDNEPTQFLGLKSSKAFYFLAGATVMIIALPFVDWTGAINHKLISESSSMGKWMMEAEEAAAKQIGFMLKGNSVKDLLLNLLFVATFAGVGEELFFRGVLQRLFIKMFRNPWAGIIVTALIFSAIHLQFYGFVPRFILGVLLGLIYWYSGSLWPAIFAHFAYDALAVVLIYFDPSLAEKESVTVSMGNQLLMAAISLGLIVTIVYYMKKRSTTSYEAIYARDKIDDSNPFSFE